MPVLRREGHRIVILCEGDTEELAVKHFIRTQWQADGLKAVGLRPINLRGRLQDIGPKARLFLDEEGILAVFSLIDLYGMDRVEHSPSDSLDTKVERVRDWLRRQVNHSRSGDFRPHVSVHETEAWILAEGAALAARLPDTSIQPDPNAEQKDFQQPPSKRINDLFLRKNPTKRYQKILDGRPLFAALKFDSVYNACHYFRSFYDDLRAVTRS